MMRLSCAALCVLVGVLPASADTLIVESGQPRAAIVTAPEPSENATRAAKELQRFIARMSGCTLPIQSLPARDLAPGTARLLVGHCS